MFWSSKPTPVPTMSEPTAPTDLTDTPPLLPPKDPLPSSFNPKKKNRSPVRPGTSGTELNLRTNRQKAQSSYQRAQRAEQAYRARRQANNARKDIEAAKEHLGEVKGQLGGIGRSLKLGVVYGWKAVRAGPAVLRERRERNRVEAEAKKLEGIEKERSMWEEKARKAAEKAKRQEGVDESDTVVADAGEGGAPKEGEEEDAEAMLKRLEALKS